MGDRESTPFAAAEEGGEEVYGKCEGGGVEAIWEFEGAYGCFAGDGVGVRDGLGEWKKDGRE